MDAGGRLGEGADALLRSWPRLAAGADLKYENISDQASSILRLQYREVMGAVLQRNNASVVLRAVGESGILNQTLSLLWGVVAGPA